MLAIGGAPHGTLVTTSLQTAGRGRQGRRWTAPAHSSLLMSLIVRSPPPLLPLLAAVAVCDVVGEDAQIKWPNDVVLPRAGGIAKLAGILAEGRPQEGWAVLGIGLNVALESWRARDALYGREITWATGGAASPAGRGRAEGIDGTGRLVVALADGARTALDAGEVHLQAIGQDVDESAGPHSRA